MLYVLDLDDTLYLERDFVRSGFQAVDHWIHDHRGVGGFFIDAWRLFEEGNRGNIFDLVLADLQLKEDGLIKQLVTVYRTHKPAISLVPDAADFLKSHERKDLAIITDGYTNVQWSKIKALDLNRRVGQIIATDDWGEAYWKPHPRSFVEISKGHDPADCIYIADNPAKDFKAPEQLGWAPSIRIRRPESLHRNKITPIGCTEVSSLSEIRH